MDENTPKLMEGKNGLKSTECYQYHHGYDERQI